MSAQEAIPEVRTLSGLGPLENNVYVVVDPATNRGIIVDASFDARRIAETAQGVDVECIVLTHGDADHIDALEELKGIFPVPAGIHPADADRLPSPPDFAIHDGDEIQAGTLRLRVLHTPGHTPGSICLHARDVLISGDTLFPGGPGATRGDQDRFAQIISAIREKLLVLPDDTAVLPGHGNPTTIGAEKPSLDEWIARGY